LSESIPGDTESAAIKWATGKAQREAKETGRNGEIDIAVARPDGANGPYRYRFVVYNTLTNRARFRA